MSTLTESRAQVILSLYPAMDDGIEEFERLPSGLFNENASFVIRGQKYVLKKLPAQRNLERHAFVTHWQNHLARQGFPCPTFIPNKGGELVTAGEGDHWTVQTWAQGEPLPPATLQGPATMSIMVGVGATLGRLHALSAAALASGATSAAGRSTRVSLPELVSGCRASLERLSSGGRLRPSPVTLLGWKPFKSAADKEILDVLPDVKSACEELAGWDSSSMPGSSRPIPCHGDINWENLLFRGEELSAVLDFDNALEMDPAYEVAAAAAVICRHDPQKRQYFLAGYRENAELRVSEEDLQRLMLLKCLKSLLYQIELALHGGTGNEAMARDWRTYLGKGIRAYSRGV